jgi:O-antigen ligase
MESLSKSKNPEPSLADCYAIRLKALWISIKQEKLSFWMLCAYFFFEYVRPQSAYPVLEFLPWGQIALLLTLATVFFDNSVKWVGNPENRLFITFAFIIILSGFFAFKPSLSWDYRNVMLGWFLVYFLLINIINTEKRLFLFVLIYLIFNFKMSQHGFFSWAGRGFAFTKWGLVGTGGWFRNSGEFTIQMLIFGPMAMGFIYGLKDNWGRLKKWFFYFMPFTAAMCVLGGSSRGSQLGLAAIAVMVLLKARLGLKLLLPLVLLAVVSFNFLPEEQKQRFREMGTDETSLQRYEYWKFGLKTMADHKIIGVGYANWFQYYFFSGEWTVWPREPHNIFIKAGAELGYTGLICFIFMILYVFILNARTRRAAKSLNNQFLYYMAHGLDAGLLGYLVAGFFVTVLYYPFFWVQMAITVALYSVTSKLAASQGDVPAGNAFANRRQ